MNCNPPPHIFRSTQFRPLMLAAVAVFWILAILPAWAQLPEFVTDPEDGGEFSDQFTITFLQVMQDPIAIRFEGTGGVQFDAAWENFGGVIPNQILICTPQSALPPGNTVTWTVNPDGTGFTTLSGTVITTTSGTFRVPGGSVTVSVTPTPGEGEVYDPSLGVPVIFEFSEAMDTSAPLDAAISMSPGTWAFSWQGDTIVTCTLQGAAVPGTVSYTLSGFQSAGGTPMDEFNGSFIIEDGGGGDVTMIPFPASGATYDPATDGPVTFTFSEAMDQTVDPDTAVTFTQGTWQCDWLNSTTVACVAGGTLAAGACAYTLDGFRTLAGQDVEFLFGSFIVSGGGSGEGTPAPDCPTEPLALSFPKSMSVCGAGAFAWGQATLYPVAQGGFVLTGVHDSATGSLASLALLNGEGLLMATVQATEAGTHLVPGNAGRLLASRFVDSSDKFTFGVYQMNNNLTPVFENQLAAAGKSASVVPLSDGRFLLAHDLDTQIELMLFQSNGNLAWAKRYSSTAFGAGAGGGIPGIGGSQYISVFEFSSGFVLAVSQSEMMLSGSDFVPRSTNLLTRLDASGSVQWTKKFTGLNAFPAPTIAVLEDETYVIEAITADIPDVGDPTVKSVLVKLDANGNPVWGREIPGPSLAFTGKLSDGRLLLAGSTVNPASDDTQSLVAIMDASGALQQQVRINILDSNSGFAQLSGDRILYSLIASTNGSSVASPRTAVLGSSNQDLQDWIWRQYARPVDSVLASPVHTSGTVLFSAFREADHAVDGVTLSEALEADAACALFTTPTVEVTPTSFVAGPVSVEVSSETVSGADFTPDILAGSIGLAEYTTADEGLCSTGPGEPMPVTIVVQFDASSNVTVEFESVADFNYTLQRVGVIGGTWSDVEVISGSGATVTRTFAPEGNEGYYRVLTSVP